MTYNKRLPSMRSLKKLASWDGPFPIKAHYMLLGAYRYGLNDDVIDFLQLFPRNEVFRDRDDFLQRCENLEAIIRSEHDLPAEILRSPQG